MGRKRSSDSSAGIGGAIFVIVVLIAMIPKPVWITLGVIAAVAVIAWIVVSIAKAETMRREAAAAAAQREREELARRRRQERIAALGKKNAARLENALSAAKRIVASEAARAGWLGDVDFTEDIKKIKKNFKRSHDLRQVIDKLSALADPSADDRRILAEAKTSADNLERTAVNRVVLIEKCAAEAQSIDDSLRKEREDALIAEQRAELHGKLSAMLYGIEATPDTTSGDSAVDAVMARVRAYREIKHQIDLARDSEAP